MGLLAIVLAWAAASNFVDPEVFPGPGLVLGTLLQRLRDGSLVTGIGLSFKRLLLGYLLSLLSGGVLGVFMAASQRFREATGPIITGLQALPSVCWVPLGLLWFGLSDAAILFVIVLGSSLSIAISIDAGCRNIPPLFVRAARTMGANGLILYRRVILPAAFPEILTGLRLAWAFAWRSLMAGELLFVTGGLGQLLAVGRELGDMAQVVAVMLVIILLGLTTEHLLFARLQERLRVRWGLAR
ncbi:MAG: ABC transporter permease subunit [Myxococcales bacterium]|nr:ABC transporter permease subunit [Polyangiaceae bacterium]MDW8248121.1 ABC transporter permease subunit [Myxococcales bacterium]